MTISRDTLELNCSSDKIFDALRTLNLRGFKVSKTDVSNGLVVLKTSMGLLSWGETVEVTVMPFAGGCSVSLRSSSNHPLNITSNTSTPIRRLVEYLQSLC